MKRNNLYKTVLLSSVLLFSTTSLCSAAPTAQNESLASDPSKLLEQFKKAPMPKSKLPSMPRSQESKVKPSKDNGAGFMLNSVSFHGNTALGDDVLKNQFSELVGQKVSVMDVDNAVREVTRFYRDQGFILSKAILPTQNIKSGNVKITIIEGYISKVIIKGDMELADERIHKYVKDIETNKPADNKVMERALLLMNEIPGIKATSTVRPSPRIKNASELVLNLEVKDYSAFVSLNNDGTESVGPEQFAANVSFNIPGMAQIGMNVAGAFQLKEFKSGGLSYKMPLGDDGLSVSVNANLSKTEPSGATKVEGKTQSGSLMLSYPIIRTRSESLIFTSGLSVTNTDTDIAGGATKQRDKLRVLSAKLAYDFADEMKGANLIEAELRQGIDGMGAISNDSKLKTRVKGINDFTSAKFTVSRLQNIDGGFDAYIIGKAQMTSDDLLSGERFGLGGAPLNRSYPVSSTTGDKGLQARLEFRYSGAIEDMLDSYMAYSFLTHGKIWNISPTADEESSLALNGAGLGLRFTVMKDISLYAEYGIPFKKKIGTSSQKNKFYAGVSMAF